MTVWESSIHKDFVKLYKRKIPIFIINFSNYLSPMYMNDYFRKYIG